MADLNPQERLQPFLLDRLTDEQPESIQESREHRIFSSNEQRRAMLRDLSWLLNSDNHGRLDSLADFPEVEKSVINFGMAELSGITASHLTPKDIERFVTTAITRFEPRIIRRTLSVRAIRVNEDEAVNVVVLEIRGDVWNLPVPDVLFVRTEVDLETGHCFLREQGR